MDFKAPLHTGGTVVNYRSRPVVSGDLVSITGNAAQGESIYAIVKVKPPQDYVTYIDGSDMEISGGYYYRVGQVTRVWLGFNPDIAGWRVELTKDKVETFLNQNEGQGTWALHQPGDLTPSDLGIPPAAEADDQVYEELADPALSATTGASGLKMNYEAGGSYNVTIKMWYPGMDGGGGTTATLTDTNGDIGAVFIDQVKALKRKLTDATVEMGFDKLDLVEPGHTYNYGADFFSRYGIRSTALARTGKWNITLGGQTATIDGPGNFTGISNVEAAQDGRVFKYYKNNLGHIEGVRYQGNYYSIPTIDLGVPVSEYVNHVLELDAESSLDANTAIIAGIDGLTSLLGSIETAAITKKPALGAVSNALNGGLGPLIPQEYQSTLGYALAGALGLTSLQTAYQKKLQLSGVNGALVKSTVSDVSYAYPSATGFTTIGDLTAFTVGSSTLFRSSNISGGNVGRKRSATPIQVTYLGPRDALSEGLAYVSSGFYVRAQI